MSCVVPGADRLLLCNAHILSMDTAIGDLPSGDILIEDGKISAIGVGLTVSDALRIDLTDRLVMPGFIDSHRHLWEGLLRNSMPDAELQQYFYRILGLHGPNYRPQDVRLGSLVSAYGAINAGVTTVLDWSHIQNTPEHTDAAIQALLDSGIRAVFAYGPPSRGFVPWYEDTGHAYPEDLRRLRRGVLSSDSGKVTLAFGALGPEFLADEHAVREWRVADELGVRIAVHVGIGKAGRQSRLEGFARRYGLNDRTTYIHCCTLSETEWELIAQSGGRVSLSPQIEMQIGIGMPPFQRALDHGLAPSLSVDVETSAPTDMFTQMRTAFALQRGTALSRHLDDESYSPSLITSRDVLRFATLEGARANGLERITGSLTPGKQADLLCLRTDMINVIPFNDPYGAIVTAMDTSNVESVMIAGKFVKWNNVLTGVDQAALRKGVETARDRILSAASSSIDHAGSSRGPPAGHAH